MEIGLPLFNGVGQQSAHGVFLLSKAFSDWTGETELTDWDQLAVMQLWSRLSGELSHARLSDCRGEDSYIGLHCEASF